MRSSLAYVEPERETEPGRIGSWNMDDYEVVAQELSELGEKMRAIEERMTEVERVNARLEDAALSTARALGEVSRHWDAVYEAMRREETIDRETSSGRDHTASRARRT